MRTIGKVTLGDLGLMQRRGLTPKQAVDAMLAEAKARHPRAEGVVIAKSALHDGFDIIAL